GFPLPLDAITGRVVCASDPRRFRTLKIGVDARGSAPRGQVSGRGLVCSPPANAPPDAPGHGYVEVDLDFRADHVPVDGELHAALRGLADPVPPAGTWEPFAPANGAIS